MTVLTLLGFGSVSSDDVKVSGSQLGAGYCVSTPAMVEAVRLMASQESLLLDPTEQGVRRIVGRYFGSTIPGRLQPPLHYDWRERAGALS
jgi:hypothetical protein